MPHQPVLLKEAVEYLNPKPNQNYIDCTLGDGGHARAILEKTAPDGKILGIDCDAEAIENVKCQMSNVKLLNRVILVNENFRNLEKIVKENKFYPIHGILLDLGFSSSTLERGRGFTFQKDEPLDMRFNPSQDLTAAEIVNSWSEKDLRAIFEKYGEERLADFIARAIIEKRKKERILTTKQLNEIILAAYRQKLGTKKEIPWTGGVHPSTKVFMALRIAVNDELNALAEVLPQAVEILKLGGRLVVISFHSGEDRIVKNFLKLQKKEGILKILTKKPLVASPIEIQENPASRSAKLRAAIKQEYKNIVE